MKMKNLGKIFGLLFVALFGAHLYAGDVEIYVDHKKVVLGDSVTVRISVFGNDVEAPQIDELCGTQIVASSSQASTQIIGTSITTHYNFIYTFEPEKSCTIDPIPVKVDGKVLTTKPVKITVTNTPAQSRDKNFILELTADKHEVFVGESFNVTLIFKQKRGAEAIDYKFYPPKLDGFWIKYQSQPKKYDQGEYIVTEIHYKMAAQREGELEITPAKIKIASRDMTKDYWNSFAPSIKWRTYYSNPIKMKVYAPPKGIKLVGNFKIYLSVDKHEVHPSEAVNLVITIKGEGNLEDIEKFKPYIPEASVFEEEPKIDEQNGVFTQKIAIVADSNYTIPSFTLRYFDPKTKKIETISTKPVEITVIGAKKEQKPLVVKRSSDTAAHSFDASSAESPKEATIESSFAITWMILSFIAGMFMGALMVFAKFYTSNTKRLKRMNTDDKRMLFIKLLPYKEHEDVKELLAMLEEALYGRKKVAIDKKRLKEIIKKYNID